MECLRSVLTTEWVFPSEANAGGRALQRTPGVYMFPDHLSSKADWYCWAVDALDCGIFVSVKLDLEVNIKGLIKAQRKTDQWIAPPQEIRVLAILAKPMTAQEIEGGTRVSQWRPEIEIDPFSPS